MSINAAFLRRGPPLLALVFAAALASGSAGAQTVPGIGLSSGCVTPGSCTASTNGTSAVQLIAPPATIGLRLWLKSGDCENTGTATSLVALSGGASGTTVASIIVPTMGGHSFRFDPPLPLPVNTALDMTPATASTTVTCTASAYVAP